MKGYLVLENGRVFGGNLLNSCRMAGGEVVFTTSMISYQDVITDPSYFGQIVVMTYPLVGNVGFNKRSYASRSAMVRGLILREATDFPSHYEMATDMITFLNNSEIPVLTDLDTRALTKELRNRGTMGGIITDSLDNIERMQAKAKKAAAELTGDLVKFVSRRNFMSFGSGEKRVVLLDMGTKKGVIESLTGRGVEVVAVPAETNFEEIVELKPHGVVISDGPGDPHSIPYAVATCRELAGKMPLFGIGLGHQMLAMAMGAKVKRLVYGHRGCNHPVKDLSNGRVYITTQNHGFYIDEESLPDIGFEVILRSLNDNSVEGIRHREIPAFSVQFDPEGFFGYSETGFYFDEFISML